MTALSFIVRFQEGRKVCRFGVPARTEGLSDTGMFHVEHVGWLGVTNLLVFHVERRYHSPIEAFLES